MLIPWPWRTSQTFSSVGNFITILSLSSFSFNQSRILFHSLSSQMAPNKTQFLDAYTRTRESPKGILFERYLLIHPFTFSPRSRVCYEAWLLFYSLFRDMGFGDRMPFSSAIMKDVTFINERMLQVQVEKVRYTEEKKANLDECSLTLDHQTRQGKQTDTTTKRTIWKKRRSILHRI